MALANDIGMYVEEILVYLTYTVKIDSSGALLCVQQVRLVGCLLWNTLKNLFVWCVVL